jgi:membrane-associated protein
MESVIEILKSLLDPYTYINNGGLWIILFIVFAETGLFLGFFLPGDSLLFVCGMYSTPLISAGLGMDTGSDFLNLGLLSAFIITAGVIGNFVGYWFGKTSGPALYKRKDSLLFKRKHLERAREFYEQNGTRTIFFARFLPIIRTFAPIVAGIVGMDSRKFTFFNIIGCVAWTISMLFTGHYLNEFVKQKFGVSLEDYIELIVISIILVTTIPVVIKLFFPKKKTGKDDLNI